LSLQSSLIALLLDMINAWTEVTRYKIQNSLLNLSTKRTLFCG